MLNEENELFWERIFKKISILNNGDMTIAKGNGLLFLSFFPTVENNLG